MASIGVSTSPRKGNVEAGDLKTGNGETRRGVVKRA